MNRQVFIHHYCISKTFICTLKAKCCTGLRKLPSISNTLLLFLDKANAVLAATSEVPSPLVAAVIQISLHFC